MKKSEPATQQLENKTNILGSKPDKDKVFIVGIGASAGGIQALKDFFENTPADTGMAFVVILHLSPDHDSLLAQILQTTSLMPVTQVSEELTVEKNHVYVISPNKHLEMLDGKILVFENMHIEDRRAPVDIFFRTLAESHGSQAVAVVLSGTGANGSMGMKRVKERGGVCFVQNPQEAEFNEMPRNSIATGLVDAILPVRDISAKIIAYKNSLGKIKIPEEPIERPEEQQQALREIFTQVRVSTGHDFTNYKRPTLLRRIERRVNVRSLATLSEYAVYLREHPEETQALLKDLLISVTNFFRDKKVFNYLEQDVIPHILTDKTAESEIRIWVAGCATGEEAYSLAMLFAEQMPGVDAPKIQIFATDIDEAAITAAREGCYTINDAADVSPERLHRFFIKEGDEYRIRREIREMVLFARHNAIKDPPFSHLDLITCRNLLIYLNHVGQERLMETFHFALETGGYLMLGTSETVDGSADLYAPASRENHIYKSRQVPARIYPIPESVPQFRFEKTQTSEAVQNKETRSQERISYGQLHGQLLEKYAPPSVVINEEYEIVHLSESAGRYLQMAGGEPSQNLLKLIRPELRLELRSALYQALQRRTNVEVKNLKVNTGDVAEAINIHVRPALNEGEVTSGFILVLFEPVEDGGEQPVVLSRDEPVARQLDEELTRLKVQLRTSTEQHEFQSEELKASNEELQAMNEELRSATEELETGKEELQSINEELLTVNQELKVKVEEIALSNNNLQNLINSTDIGTVFLDRSFRVNMFTPSARDIFNLISNDYGRSLSDITHKLKNVDLHADAETVINKLTIIEREVETTERKNFLMRLSPYRTAQDHISGVVVTFVDITKRKQQEEEVKDLASQIEQQARIFNTTLTSISDFAYIFNREGRFEYSNQPLVDLLGITSKEIIGKNFFDLNYPNDLAARLQKQIQYVFDTKKIVKDEMPFTNTEGRQGYYEYIFTPVFAADGAMVEFVAGSTRDITERKLNEIELKNYQSRLDNAMKAGKIFSWEMNPETRNLEWSGNTESVLGFPLLGNIDKTFELIHPDDIKPTVDAINESIETGKMYESEYRLVNPVNSNIFWMRSQGIVTKDTVDGQRRFVGITQNITDRKQSEELLKDSENRLQLAIKGAHIFTWEVNPLTGNTKYAGIIKDVLGFDISENTNQNYINIHPDDKEFVLKALGEAMSGKSMLDVEHRIVNPENNEIVWVRAQGQLVKRTPDKPAVFIGITQNVTTHKLAEKALRASESRLQKAMQIQTVGVIFFNDDGQIVDANTAFAEMTGYSYEQAMRLNVKDITPPEWMPAMNDAMQELKTRGIATPYEKELLRRNGSRWWALCAKAAVKENENVEYIIDVTQRREAEEALHQSEERYRIALLSANMAAWDWNIKEDTVNWNEQHFYLLGLNPDGKEKKAADFIQTIYPDDMEKVNAALQKAINQTGLYQAEFRIIRADDKRVCWMSGYGRAVTKENGKATRMVGVMYDITERKKLEQQKEDFISIASHELKTPVTSIKAYAEVLHDMFSESGNAENADLMQKMDEQVDRLIELIRALLDTSKINEGELTLNLEKFDLNNLVKQRIKDLQQISTNHHIITYGKEIFMTADKERIGQVLTNLISNAIKYSPKSGDIIISWNEEEDNIKLSVRDTGIGIPEEMQKKVFDRFFRVKNAQMQNYPGMGLGLYITANIVHRHNGKIWVESKPGEGSAFYVSIPKHLKK